MPFATNQGTKIYFEVEGQGPPILLSHGLTGDTSYWREYGFVGRLNSKYTVINYNTRGHGKSDKPHEWQDYDFQLLVHDVIAILDTLGIAKTHFWGYSMGGGIGFGMAKYFPERLLSLIAGGASASSQPNEDNDEPNPLLVQFRRGVAEGPDAGVEGLRALFGPITPQYEKRLRSLDFEAMVALMERNKRRPAYLGADVLKIKLPCLFYAGDRDENAHEYGMDIVKHLPNARYFSIPGLGHGGASNAMDQIMPEVLSFLACVDANKPVTNT